MLGTGPNLTKFLLQGSVSRDFRPPVFFHDLNPSGPLINRLKYFRIRFRFRRDIQILKKLRGVHPMKTKHLKKLCGVHPTAESDSAVCIIPRSQALQCASHRGVSNLPSVCFDGFEILHTAELVSAVWCTPQSPTPRWDAHGGVFQMLCFHDFTVWCTPRSLTPRWDAHCRAF